MLSHTHDCAQKCPFKAESGSTTLAPNYELKFDILCALNCSTKMLITNAYGSSKTEMIFIIVIIFTNGIHTNDINPITRIMIMDIDEF